jgi:spore coat protein A, manganese oxidase
MASAAAGMLVPRVSAQQSDETSENVLTGVRLEPFVDPLPLPRVLRPATVKDGCPCYQVTMSEFRQKLHRDLPPTLLWGFEGSTPGPTIVAKRGSPVAIDWINRLPAQHRLLIDHTLDGAGKDVPEVRTAVHLHGGHVGPESDGYPEDWVTPGHQQHTFYPNRQPAAMLWYHDHAMGITRLNAMMGLAGIYRIDDPEEERLGLPSGKFDISLVLQDRILDAGGQLVYPPGPSPEAPWVPEFFGSHVLVNGCVWPFLQVEPRLYRFRLLNASNTRVFEMALTPEQPFVLIGSDGGLLRQPVARNTLLITPGERLDLILDFRGREGRRLSLVNFGRAPYPSGGAPVPGPVLQFQVERPLTEASAGHVDIPASLGGVQPLEETSAVKTRRLKLVEVMGKDGRMHRTLLDGKRFMDPISEDPQKGSTEIWEFVNTTLDAHPIHLHAVHFQLLDRRSFDVARERRTHEVVFTGKALQAAPEEQGWKDTILCPPRQVTRIIIPFNGEPGRFVWHCHMLEHEDNEMMRPYLVRA